MKLTIVTIALVAFVYDTSASISECPAPVDGYWGEFGEFSPCSVTCGVGHKTKHRFCHPPKYGGKSCDHDGSKSYLKLECNEGPCPVEKTAEWVDTTKCNRNCGRPAYKKQKKVCKPPTNYGSIPCYKCNDKQEERVVSCGSIKPCDTPPHGVCKECHKKALEDRENYGPAYATFVGHACRVDKSFCDGLTNGIRDMYASEYWFFLHCSPDGPWCKPCATAGLVYNPNCGQCETTRDGPCTGPETWRNIDPHASHDEQTKRDYTKKDVLNDDDMW